MRVKVGDATIMDKGTVSMEGESDEELDNPRVRTIVGEIFKKAKQPLPDEIEVLSEKPTKLGSEVCLDEGRLRVVASTENQLRRLVGRFLISQEWSPITWFFVNHGRWFVIINAFILGVLLRGVDILLSQIIPDQHPMVGGWAIILTTLALAVVIYTAPIQHAKLKRRLSIRAKQLDCMTEYDASLYALDQNHLILTFLIPIIWTFMVVNPIVGGASPFNDFYAIIEDTLFLWSLSSIYISFIPFMVSSKSNLCHRRGRDNPIDDTHFRVTETLQDAFTRTIDRLEVREGLYSEYGEFDSVILKFRDIKYAQCRKNYIKSDEKQLICKATDISERAAYRFGVAKLVMKSVEARPYRRWPLIGSGAFNLLFSSFSIFILMILRIVTSKNGTVIAGGAILLFFTISWFYQWKYDDKIRNELISLLGMADLFSEESIKFYAKTVNNRHSIKMDLAILIIGIILITTSTWLMTLVELK